MKAIAINAKYVTRVTWDGETLTVYYQGSGVDKLRPAVDGALALRDIRKAMGAAGVEIEEDDGT